MPYRLLADVVIVVHLAFIAFVLLGGLLVLAAPRVAWVHLPAAAWGAWVEFRGLVCPLTPLENWLRERGGLSPYDTDFVARYLTPVLYPAALTREMQWALGTVVLIVNAVVYLALVRRIRRRAMADD